jgi:hypothetical protein
MGGIALPYADHVQPTQSHNSSEQTMASQPSTFKQTQEKLAFER